MRQRESNSVDGDTINEESLAVIFSPPILPPGTNFSVTYWHTPLRCMNDLSSSPHSALVQPAQPSAWETQNNAEKRGIRTAQFRGHSNQREFF